MESTLKEGLENCCFKRQTNHSTKLSTILNGAIFRDPGATSRNEAIFLGESLLQELKSPWELILSGLVSNANQRGGPAG